MKWIGCLAWLAAVGCGVSSAAPLAPDDVVTGLYRVEITREDDTCDPLRFTGTVEPVPVIRDDAGLSVWEPGAIARDVRTLRAVDWYTVQIPAEGQTLDPCADHTSSVVFTSTLTSASERELEIVADESWSLAHPCAGIVGAATVPNASCSATRSLHYELVQPCPSPCSIDAATSTCSCE